MGRHEALWTGDTGLARERTDLSWGRTLLSVMTVTALFLRWLPQFGGDVLVPVILGIAAGLGLAGHGDAAHEVIGLTALVLIVGLAGLVLIVIPI